MIILESIITRVKSLAEVLSRGILTYSGILGCLRCCIEWSAAKIKSTTHINNDYIFCASLTDLVCQTGCWDIVERPR